MHIITFHRMLSAPCMVAQPSKHIRSLSGCDREDIALRKLMRQRAVPVDTPAQENDKEIHKAIQHPAANRSKENQQPQYRTVNQILQIQPYRPDIDIAPGLIHQSLSDHK